MIPWLPTFVGLLAVTGVPLLVLAVLVGTGRTLGRVLPTLVSFGAGSVVGAAVFHLLPEAYARHPEVGFVALSVSGGLIGAYAVERLLHRFQHTAHEAPAREPALSAFDDPAMVAVNFGVDAVHNFVDGALVAAAFLAGPGPGVATTLAVLAHELPREVGTFGVYVHYGSRPRRALGLVLLSGLLGFAAAALTLWFGEETAHATEVVVPVAAGAFLFVGGAVMLSQLKAQKTWEFPRSQLLACAAGLLLSAAATLLSGGH